MISRVAESCFWLNRYIERVEVMARILQVNAAFQLDSGLDDEACWRPVVIVAGQEGDYVKRIAPAIVGNDEAEVVQEYLTWDEENPSSIRSSLRMARENARTIRETISLEMWETLNDLWVWLGEREAWRLYERDRMDFYIRLRNQSLLFHGIARATMLHEDPFEFMRLGTALERLGQVARILDINHHGVSDADVPHETAAEIAQWLAILRFCSGVEPFLKRHNAAPSGHAVADFMIFDRAFARSVRHNLDQVCELLALVAPESGAGGGLQAMAIAERTRANLDAATIESMVSSGLHEALTHLVDTSAELSNAIREDFFDPVPVRSHEPGETPA